MPKARRGRTHLTFVLFALLLSCNTPESIGKFCASAVATLRAGDTFFDDMQASCIRTAETYEPFAAFQTSSPNSEPCVAIGKQAEGLKAASKILANYFTALKDLASFGNTKAGADAKDLFSKATAHANLAKPSAKALGSVADFLTRVAVSGYQRKHLADEISNVHEDLKAALDGLGEAVGVVYVNQLQNEENKTAARYREFLLRHPGGAETLILDARWQSDRAAFDRKQKAALNYKTALETLARGNEDLAAHARNLKTKQLAALLSPYTAQLENQLPAYGPSF